MFEDFKQKESLIIVYTGDGKGKTSASLGLVARGLGSGWKVAYVQFLKQWDVSEHKFLRAIKAIYKSKIQLVVGGKGFYKAGELSAKNVSDEQHKRAAVATYKRALDMSRSGKFNLVICDELSNSVHDGLLSLKQLESLMKNKHPKTNLCITGRNFPRSLLKYADIATDMRKIKHHYDEKYLANAGIDY